MLEGSHWDTKLESWEEGGCRGPREKRRLTGAQCPLSMSLTGSMSQTHEGSRKQRLDSWPATLIEWYPDLLWHLTAVGWLRGINTVASTVASHTQANPLGLPAAHCGERPKEK